jgi:hypothetical protein
VVTKEGDNSDQPQRDSDWYPYYPLDISILGAMGKELVGRNPPTRGVVDNYPGGYSEPKGIKK